MAEKWSGLQYKRVALDES